MKVVVIVDNSAGNESVGEMWKETKIFDSDNKIMDVIDWVAFISNGNIHKKNIVITVPN